MQRQRRLPFVIGAEKLVVRVIATTEAGSAGLDKAVINLRKELAELNIGLVGSIKDDDPPADAKGLGTIIDALSVFFTGWDVVAAALGAMAGSWVSKDRTIHISFGEDTLVLKNATRAERQQLIDEWIARHRDGQ